MALYDPPKARELKTIPVTDSIVAVEASELRGYLNEIRDIVGIAKKLIEQMDQHPEIERYFFDQYVLYKLTSKRMRGEFDFIESHEYAQKLLSYGSSFPQADDGFIEQTKKDLALSEQGRHLIEFAEAHNVTIVAYKIPVEADDFLTAGAKFKPIPPYEITLYQREKFKGGDRAINAMCLGHELRHAWQLLEPRNAELATKMRATPYGELYYTKAIEADARAHDTIFNFNTMRVLYEEQKPISFSEYLPICLEAYNSWFSEPSAYELILSEIFGEVAGKQRDGYEIPKHGELLKQLDFEQGWQDFCANLGQLEMDFMRALTRFVGTNISYMDADPSLAMRSMHRMRQVKGLTA